MRIAIAGAGICGAYLYRRLMYEGHCPTIYDVGEVNPNQKCGISSCAWLVPNPEIFDYMIKAGLQGRYKYILEPIEKMVFAGVDLKVKMVTIHKPNLIADLIGGDRIRRDTIDGSEYDMIVDATGTARAYLGRQMTGPRDIIGGGIQIRVTVKNYPGDTAHILPVKGGYLWVFPLSNNQVHAGIATHTPQKYMFTDIANMIEPIVGSILEPELSENLQCACRSKVRITGLLPPFYTCGARATNDPSLRTSSIYGVGEAIGAVSPLTGEGIIPGLQSCEVFLKNLRNNTLNVYSDDINSTFAWIYRERAVLDRIMQTGEVSMLSFWILRRMLKRCNCRAPMLSLFRIAQTMKS